MHNDSFPVQVCFSLWGISLGYPSSGDFTGLSLACHWGRLKSAKELILSKAAPPQWWIKIEAAPWWENCKKFFLPSQSHLGPQCYWAPVAHSDNRLINTVCVDFLLFLCHFFLPVFPGIAPQRNYLPPNPCLGICYWRSSTYVSRKEGGRKGSV